MAKIVKEVKEEKFKIVQHLFHINNVKQKEKEGWKVVKAHIDNHKRETDLVLMEK